MKSSLKNSLEGLQQKARERTVKTQTIEYDLETLVKKIDRGVIKIDPAYQRNHRWDKATSSKLIESLILNIPIPFVYLSLDVDVDVEAEADVSRYSVIDGQQRLTAIHSFFKNHLALRGLSSLEELDGMKFKDLPPFLVRRLEERTIRCLRIDSTVDAQVKYDIFERLNSGSVELTAQELRNAVYRGRFNDRLKQLAQTKDFRALLQVNPKKPERSSKVRKMEDVELVLRFYALDNGGYRKLNVKMKEYLNERMKSHQAASPEQLDQFGKNFLAVMSMIKRSHGDQAFAKYRFDEELGEYEQMSSFNVAVYDALSIAVSEEMAAHGDNAKLPSQESFRTLFADPDFFDTVSGSINDKKKVVARINAARKLFAHEHISG